MSKKILYFIKTPVTLFVTRGFSKRLPESDDFRNWIFSIKTEYIPHFMLILRYNTTKGGTMKEIVSIKRKRVCKFLHCKNILSIYNPGVYCYVHQREVNNKKSHPLSTVKVR